MEGGCVKNYDICGRNSWKAHSKVEWALFCFCNADKGYLGSTHR